MKNVQLLFELLLFPFLFIARKGKAQKSAVLLFLMLFSSVHAANSCPTSEVLIDANGRTDTDWTAWNHQNISGSGDADYFKVVLTTKTELKISVNNKTSWGGKKIRFRLLKDDCTTAAGMNGNDQDYTKTKVLDAGTYYAKFYYSNGNTNYKIRARFRYIADLEIDKSANASSVTTGDTVTFTLLAKNNGPTGSKIRVTDTIPSGFTINSVTDDKGSFSCSTSGQTVTCDGSQNFTSGEDVTITVETTAATAGNYTNTASVESTNERSEPDLSNNSDSISITVNAPVNQPPTAVASVSPSSGPEGTSFNFDGSGSSDDSGIVSYEWKEGGTLLSSLETFSKNDFSTGSHTITLTVTDAEGLSNSDSVSITVNANQPPTAEDINASTDQNTSVEITLIGNDPDNGPNSSLNYQIVQGPAHGQLSGAEPTITYTPDVDFTGTDTFTYRTYDGKDYSDEATVTITVREIINVSDAPVCIESITYGKKGGIADTCFNADGIFQGGTGCLQQLKLRNLSDQNISSSIINVDYSTFDGTLDNTCSIDKVDETDQDCNVSTSPKEAYYDPFRSFDQYETHTLSLGVLNANNGSSPFDGNITIKYILNDTQYIGQIAKCQIESNTSEDLCYDSVNTDGFMCFSMGDFFSGGIGCKTTINLRNQGDSTLYSPSVDLITNSLFSGHMIDDCGIDETSGNCSDSDVLDTAFFGMSGLGMARTITYDPMPDFDNNDTHSTFTKSLISANLFNKTTLLGTYIKDGKLYHGEIKECGACIKVYFDKDHYDVREDINIIGTTEVVHPVIKLSRASDEDVTVHYHTIDGTATVADGDYVNIDDQTITIPAGETNVTITVQVYNDEPIELDEYFFVQLTDPEGACLDDRNTTQINILAQEDAPVCFEDDFDNGLDSKWRVLPNNTVTTSSPYTPNVVTVNGDARLRITENTTDIAAVITKDYEFTTSQNLIIVEFDYYAYGGCGNSHGGLGADGADGIVNILFDSSVGDTPVPGGTGGSMGYAQTSDFGGQNGFEGGWLGLGIDEYGNFGNCNEQRQGGLPNTSCDWGSGFDPQDHRNTAVIRGDGSGMSGYEFLKGVELTKSPLNQPKVANKSANDYYSGRYKMTVDARDPNHLYIRLERDLGDGNGYQVIIDQFDAKDAQYNQGTTPDLVRYAISGGTGGGCNYHELGWIKLRGNCAAYGAQSYESGPFDAWDTFRNVNDRNISTKLSNSDFNLRLASLNETHTGTELKTSANRVYYGLVRRSSTDNSYTYVVDPLDNPALNFTTAETYTKTFNVNSAVADTKAVFRFCADYNGTAYTLYPPDDNCTGQPSIVLWPNEHNIVGWREVLSSDSFTIRPDHFTIDANNSTIGAGNEFTVTLHAVDGSGNDVPDYNETVNIWGASPTLDHNESNTICNTGTLSKISGGFIDGKADITLTYDEVGSLKLLLTEHNSTDYAHIDLDDTDYNATTTDSSNHGGSIYRQIDTSEALRNFVPDHFELANIQLHDHHEANDINFTYLASDSTHAIIDQTMAATLDLDIIAYTEQNTTTANYNSICYAQNINSLVIGYEFNTTNLSETYPVGLSNILYHWYDDSTTLHEGSGSQAFGTKVDIASASSTIGNAIFNSDHNGTAKLKIQFNFDRSYNTPVNPFIFSITDINVSDANGITDINNSAKPDHNATYLYARAKATKDFYNDETTSPVNTPIKVEVYCNRWPVSAANCPSIDIVNGQTNDYKWWLSTKHNMANNDGNITLTTTTANAGLQPTNGVVTINLAQQGIDSNINVTGTAPSLIDIDFDTTNATDTSLWLIHNKDNDSILSPFYQVDLVGSMDWAGHGDTGNVVESNASQHRNRRLGW